MLPSCPAFSILFRRVFVAQDLVELLVSSEPNSTAIVDWSRKKQILHYPRLNSVLGAGQTVLLLYFSNAALTLLCATGQ